MANRGPEMIRRVSASPVAMQSVDASIEEAAVSNTTVQERLLTIRDPLCRGVVRLIIEDWSLRDIAELFVLPVTEIDKLFMKAKHELQIAQRRT